MHLAGRTRRRLLRDLGAAALAWPAARLLGASVAHAQTTTAPRRLLLLHTPHGRSRPHWLPETNPDGTLRLDRTVNGDPATLAPLAPFADQLVVINGLDLASAYAGGVTGHEGGLASVFTGAAADSNSGTTSTGPSIDHVVAGELAAQGVVMPAGVQVFGVASYSMCFHSEVGGSWQRSADPRVVGSRYELFSGIAPSGGEPDPRILRRNARRKAAIDFAAERVRSLRGDLSGHERDKLDRHLDALAGIRRRFDEAPPPLATCTPPTEGPQPPFWDGSRSPELAALQAELITELFACDLTRVQSWMLGDSFSNALPTWLGIDVSAHDTLVHGSNVTIGGQEYPGAVWDGMGLTTNNPPANRAYARLMHWYSEMVALLFARMHAIPEENGRTLLENTLVVWLSDMGNPAAHSNVDVPCVITGGGVFRGNRLLTVGDTNSTGRDVATMTPHNRLLVSVAQAFGSTRDTVGSAQFRGPLAGL